VGLDRAIPRLRLLLAAAQDACGVGTEWDRHPANQRARAATLWTARKLAAAAAPCFTSSRRVRGEPPSEHIGVIQLVVRGRDGIEHSLFVWLGRTHPTAHQLARASAGLRTAAP
jgi:hypothetical protein